MVGAPHQNKLRRVVGRLTRNVALYGELGNLPQVAPERLTLPADVDPPQPTKLRMFFGRLTRTVTLYGALGNLPPGAPAPLTQ